MYINSQHFYNSTNYVVLYKNIDKYLHFLICVQMWCYRPLLHYRRFCSLTTISFCLWTDKKRERTKPPRLQLTEKTWLITSTYTKTLNGCTNKINRKLTLTVIPLRPFQIVRHWLRPSISLLDYFFSSAFSPRTHTDLFYYVNGIKIKINSGDEKMAAGHVTIKYASLPLPLFFVGKKYFKLLFKVDHRVILTSSLLFTVFREWP